MCYCLVLLFLFDSAILKLQHFFYLSYQDTNWLKVRFIICMGRNDGMCSLNVITVLPLMLPCYMPVYRAVLCQISYWFKIPGSDPQYSYMVVPRKFLSKSLLKNRNIFGHRGSGFCWYRTTKNNHAVFFCFLFVCMFYFYTFATNLLKVMQNTINNCSTVDFIEFIVGLCKLLKIFLKCKL